MSTYLKNDGASDEIQEQRAVVEMAYDLRHGGSSDYAQYQSELEKLNKLIGEQR